MQGSERLLYVRDERSVIYYKVQPTLYRKPSKHNPSFCRVLLLSVTHKASNGTMVL